MSKCRYPDMKLNTEKDAMKRFVDSSDRKAAYDMRKQESAHCGTSKPQGSREILRDPFTLTWFVAYATATGLLILALFL